MQLACGLWCGAFVVLAVSAVTAAQLLKDDDWMVVLPSGAVLADEVRPAADHRRQRTTARLTHRRTTGLPWNHRPGPTPSDVSADSAEPAGSRPVVAKKKTKYKRMWDEPEGQASEIQNVTTKRPDRIKTRRRLVPPSSTARTTVHTAVVLQEDPYFDFGKKIRNTPSTAAAGVNALDLETRTSVKSPVIVSTTEEDRSARSEPPVSTRTRGVQQTARNHNGTSPRRPENQTAECVYHRYTRRNKSRSQRDARCLPDSDARTTRILSTVVTSVSVKGTDRKNDTGDDMPTTDSGASTSAEPPKYLRNRYRNISLPEYLEITKVNQRRLNATTTALPRATGAGQVESSINSSSYASLQQYSEAGMEQNTEELPATTGGLSTDNPSPPTDLQDYIYLVNGTSSSESSPTDPSTRNPAAVEARQKRPLKNLTRAPAEHDVGVIYPEGLATSTYLLTFLAIVPLVLVIGFAFKLAIRRKKKKVFDSSEYSSEYNRSPLDFNTMTSSPITTKLPRVPQHIVWDAEKTCGAVPTMPSSNSRWEFPREKLRLQTILGQGNFGQVWKAEADDISGHEGLTRLVAVKMVKENAATREREDLIGELSIMQHLGSHPNVVTLLGCCTEKEPYLLIMEYVMYGKLLAFLRDRRTRSHYFNFSDSTASLTSRDLTMFAYCVARGMDFLGSKKIVHRDLAARNILVDHNKLCKIADFGMSRNVRDTNQIYEQRHTKGALPIRWMAPESLHYSIFTYKTDVWSFGVLMWEIVTLGSTPYCTMGAREVMRRVRDGYRLDKPAHCRSELFRVIAKCWAADPSKRPTFAELKQELAALLENPEFEGSYVDLESLVDESDSTKDRH